MGLEQGLLRCCRKLNKSVLCASSLSRQRYRLSFCTRSKSSPSRAAVATAVIQLPMQPPLAAGIDQSVSAQRLQHVQPAPALS
jgi:hypothetical protein